MAATLSITSARRLREASASMSVRVTATVDTVKLPTVRREGVTDMCRNITELRGLEPPATDEEIEAAAYQFVRKITGVTKPTGAVHDDMHAVALEIAALAHGLLDRLPARRQPPKTVPPLRRPEVRARMGLEPFAV